MSATRPGTDALCCGTFRGGFADKELVGAGLARESGYDFFQGRLLWPIR